MQQKPETLKSDYINIVRPVVKIEEYDPIYILKKIERFARKCYKTEDSNAPLGHLLSSRLLKAEKRATILERLNRGDFGDVKELKQMLDTLFDPIHSSPVEHASISVSIITNRGCTHEIVRHRIGVAYSQESTRYCRYDKDKFGNKVSMLMPYNFNSLSEENFMMWKESCEIAAKTYMELLNNGVSIEFAREILPNSTKTEIGMTYDIGAWRHFLNLRTSQKAHPEIRRVATVILENFTKYMPKLFYDIYARNLKRYPKDEAHFPGIEYVDTRIVSIENL